ncbi:MAG: N-acetylmuramoyl-L-alanine amidase [Chloroflexota bacterium]|nr:N-acetylmuramoyl-L-alanine amidase [Chloroflexota bacterium]
MRRRHRLRVAMLLAAFLLALFPRAGAPAAAAPRFSGHIVASEVTHDRPAHAHGATSRVAAAGAAAYSTGSTGGDTLLVTGDPVSAGQIFDRVGVHWVAARGTQDSFFVELRTSADGAAWSDWQLLHAEEDMVDEARNEWYAAPLIAVEGARHAQYRAWMTAGDPDALMRIGLTFMDVTDRNAGPVARLLNDVAGAINDVGRSYAALGASGDPPILTRQDWGADESLMQWIPQYQAVKKAVVHHTVTDDGGTNVAATIRGMYYFHAVTRGWGDIGYSYLVDKYGNIWTGRQGGEHTVGGHAYGWNNGSIGVAAIGDFSVATPTASMQGAIANIIALRFAQYGIAPYGADLFTHQEQSSDGSWHDVTSSPPNVQGHRDCNYIAGQNGGQTECPGNGLYARLPTIRSLAQTAVNLGFTNLARLDPVLPKVGPEGATLQVPVAVSNRGVNTIPAGTSVSYRILRQGSIVVSQGGQGTLPAALAPGAATTVTVPLSVPAIGSYVVRWDLQSAGSWWSSLYSQPVRDQWFLSADWSVDWISDSVPRDWTAGETRTVSVTVNNDGGRTWPAGGTNPVRLGYSWTSSATGNVFTSSDRVNLSADVPPGATVTLTGAVTAPAYPTTYTLTLDLVKEGEFWFADKGVAPDETPAAVGLDFHASYAPTAVPFTAGQSTTVPITITNTGRGTFPTTNAYPVHLAYHWIDSSGRTAVWDGARTSLPADLGPGQSVQLQAAVGVPGTGGAYSLRFDLVQEGVAWFSTRGVATSAQTVTVAGGTRYGANVNPWGVPAAVATSMVTTIGVDVGNASSFDWGANVNLSYHWIGPSGSVVVWDGRRSSLAGTGLEQIRTVYAEVAGPSVPGAYTLRFDIAQEGVAWFSGEGVAMPAPAVNVVVPAYGATYAAAGSASGAAGSTITTPVTLTNTGSLTMQPGAFALSYHLREQSGASFVWDGVRTALASPLATGQSATIAAQVKLPSTPGTWIVRFDAVHEGVTWYSGQGVPTAGATLTAQ